MKFINRIFVALMVVLSVFAIQSCGGSQQNGGNNSTVSADQKITPEQIVKESGIKLPLDLGEGLSLAEINCTGDAISFHVYIPSPVSMDDFQEEISYESYLADIQNLYAGNEDEDDVDRMVRKAVDNGYGVVFVFDNTEESVKYEYKSADIKKK